MRTSTKSLDSLQSFFQTGTEIQAAIQRVKAKISTLCEQQVAAEKRAALVGMTADDSRRCKEQHGRIKMLTRKLAELGSEQGPIMSKNTCKKLRGTVQKVLKPITPSEPEKAQIGVEGADDLYREIHIENVLIDKNGKKFVLGSGPRWMSSLRRIRTLHRRNLIK